MRIQPSNDGLFLQTVGAGEFDCKDFRLSVVGVDFESAHHLLQYLIAYISNQSKAIRAGETFSYGYWLIKFVESLDGYLDIYEYNSEATQFVEGGSLAIHCWATQNKLCQENKCQFMPPRPDRKVAISEGVYEGLPVQGVRYPSPEHMSGWWLTTDQYDGNVDSLQVVHMYHLTAKRPDLIPYIALPYGYRFDSSSGVVWPDKNIKQDLIQH